MLMHETPTCATAAAIERLYNKYKEADENAISVDGLISFCADLDIEPSDIRMHVFCFFLQVPFATLTCTRTRKGTRMRAPTNIRAHRHTHGCNAQSFTRVCARVYVCVCVFWRLQVKTAVRWSQQEFIGGLTRLGCDSIEKIRAVLPQLQVHLSLPLWLALSGSLPRPLSPCAE